MWTLFHFNFKSFELTHSSLFLKWQLFGWNRLGHQKYSSWIVQMSYFRNRRTRIYQSANIIHFQLLIVSFTLVIVVFHISITKGKKILRSSLYTFFEHYNGGNTHHPYFPKHFFAFYLRKWKYFFVFLFKICNGIYFSLVMRHSYFMRLISLWYKT